MLPSARSSRNLRFLNSIDVWYGGLVDGMRDASGQMYMRNRYYDPATGQFTQGDPIGLAGGLNVYGFADGDPVSYSDPYGLCAASQVDTNGLCDGGLTHAEYYSAEDGQTACLPCIGGAILRALPAAARALPFVAAAGVASSRVLRANMAAARIMPRAGHAAHHIVAGRHRQAEVARQVLARFQININDANNGVYLPTSHTGALATGSTNHRLLHTNRYFAAVNELLLNARTRDEAIASLQYIASQLQQHAFPY